MVTEVGLINARETIVQLQNQATMHLLTKTTTFDSSEILTTESRYSKHAFHGILPDTGASGISSAGEQQVIALQAIDPSIKIDRSQTGGNVKFGKGASDATLGTIAVPTPFGKITFHVVSSETPFLWCIQDMDEMGVHLVNHKNLLVQGEKIIPVVRKFGHPFLLLHPPEHGIAYCHLTENELRRLHRRFGHPSVGRLARLLKRSGHEFKMDALKHLTRVCHQCQMNASAPGRYKFTLKDDRNFNYTIIVDIFMVDGEYVLHVVDEATAFQSGEFVKDMSADAAWKALLSCWFLTLQGYSDRIAHDAGTNF